MNTANNKRNFLGPLILIVLFIGVLAGGVILHFMNGKLNKAIKIKKQQLIQLQQEIKSYQSERIGKQVIKNEHKRLVGFIPTRENQEEFIWQLGKLAEDNNLKIGNYLNDFKLLTLKNLPKYQALQCQVSITGSYQNLLAFFDSLSRIAQLVLVSNVNLKLIPAANSTELPQFEALITLDLITSASSVAFSQSSSSNLVSSSQAISPSQRPMPSVKPTATVKPTPFSTKSQPTTQRSRPSGRALSTSPSPIAKRPPSASPITNPTPRNGSPVEVKTSPIMNLSN